MLKYYLSNYKNLQKLNLTTIKLITKIIRKLMVYRAILLLLSSFQKSHPKLQKQEECANLRKYYLELAYLLALVKNVLFHGFYLII